jgi:hypothetical protein
MAMPYSRLEARHGITPVLSSTGRRKYYHTIHNTTHQLHKYTYKHIAYMIMVGSGEYGQRGEDALPAGRV